MDDHVKIIGVVETEVEVKQKESNVENHHQEESKT